jgi:hypothetical protein
MLASGIGSLEEGSQLGRRRLWGEKKKIKKLAVDDINL